jgi:hypothetical protein
LYDSLAASLRSKDLSTITLFRLDQNEEPWGGLELKAYRQSVTDLAGSHGLCVQQQLIHNRDVYEEFRLGSCTPPAQR